MSALEGWDNFHVIVGSSAGALIGLQFVFLALIAEKPISKGAAQAGDAFSIPSVVHFGAVLLLAAVASAPWTVIAPLCWVWAIIGLAGVAYAFVIARRMRTQTAYQPVFEDRLFHLWLPGASYAALAVAAYTAIFRTRPAGFIAGASELLLLFVGIRNTWDAVIYHVFSGQRKKA